VPSDRQPTEGRNKLLVAAAALTAALVFLGGVVCITESIRGCPDWPGCYGRVVPPARLDAIIEYSHRVLALLTSLVIGATVAAAWSRPRAPRWVRWPLLLAIPLLGLVSMYGALAVLRGLSRWQGILDLGSALLILGLVASAAAASTAASGTLGVRTDAEPRVRLRTSSARLALATVGVLFLVLVSSVVVSEPGSPLRCLGWPLLREPAAASGALGAVLLARRLLSIGASVMVLSVIILLLRDRGQSLLARRLVPLLALELFFQMVIGVQMAAVGYELSLMLLSALTAVMLWATMVLTAMHLALQPGEPGDPKGVQRP
jgi:cytochrome c oxidase assembly protein subunit 15